MNETNSSLPNQKKGTKKAKKKPQTVPPNITHTSERLSILNIGQLLFLAFLFVMLLFQAVNIYKNNLENSAGINNISDGSVISDMLNGNRLKTEKDTVLSDHSFGSNNLPSVSDIGVADAGAIFLVGEYNGKLSIMSPDRKTVYEIFDVYIDTLPAYDRDLLYRGIEVRTQEDLLSLLEDYSS